VGFDEGPGTQDVGGHLSQADSYLTEKKHPDSAGRGLLLRAIMRVCVVGHGDICYRDMDNNGVEPTMDRLELKKTGLFG
jgi:hypothetical protein